MVQPGNEGIVHHIVLFACTGDMDDDDHGVAWECYKDVMPIAQNCIITLLVWAVGGNVSVNITIKIDYYFSVSLNEYTINSCWELTCVQLLNLFAIFLRLTSLNGVFVSLLINWWLVEVPYWWKRGCCTTILGIFWREVKDIITQGEIEPTWGEIETSIRKIGKLRKSQISPFQVEGTFGDDIY